MSGWTEKTANVFLPGKSKPIVNNLFTIKSIRNNQEKLKVNKTIDWVLLAWQKRKRQRQQMGIDEPER